MTKMTILLASSALLVLVIKNNEAVLTTKLTNSLLLLVILGSLFLAYLVNEQPDTNPVTENFYNDDNLSDSDLSLTNTTITENFENEPIDNIDSASIYSSEHNNSVIEDEPNSVIENFQDNASSNNEDAEDAEDNQSVKDTNSESNDAASIAPSDIDADSYAPVDLKSEPKKLPESCFPKDILNSAELLPKDSDTAWAENVPAGKGELKDQNFLNAGYHVGVNTVGQSLRNANRQLRSDPPCPQVKVSPWLQSTIEPDLNRRGLEIK